MTPSEVPETGATSGAATRVDSALGITEHVAFLGDRPPRIFSVLYQPARPSGASLLICPAILSEYDHTYTTEVEFARELAASGVTVLRFHYTGTGHSDGAPEAMTLATMTADAALAVQRLSRAAPARPPIILGLRFGALVAAALADRIDRAPLVLWEPAMDGRGYLREAWRADLMFQINEGSSPTTTRDGFPELLARDGVVDVLGYPVCRALHDSAVEETLLDRIGSGARSVLLVRGGPAGSQRPAFDAFAQTLRGRGCNVDVRVLGDQLVWWFQGPNMRRWARPLMAELRTLTGDWIEHLSAPGGAGQ